MRNLPTRRPGTAACAAPAAARAPPERPGPPGLAAAPRRGCGRWSAWSAGCVLFFVDGAQAARPARALRREPSSPRSRCWPRTAARSPCRGSAGPASSSSSEISPWLVEGRDRDRGPPLPPPFRRRPGRPRPRRAGQLPRRRRRRRRQHDHPAAGEEPLPHAERSLTPQAAGADAGDLARDPARARTRSSPSTSTGSISAPAPIGVEAAARRYFGKPAARREPARGGDDGRPAQGALGAGADQRPRPGPRARRRGAGAHGQSRGLHHAGAGRAAPHAPGPSSRRRPRPCSPATSSTGCWTA